MTQITNMMRDPVVVRVEGKKKGVTIRGGETVDGTLEKKNVWNNALVASGVIATGAAAAKMIETAGPGSAAPPETDKKGR
jgi:hypothetical protein